MAREKTVFVCQQCGIDSPKWQGRCPSCGEWNSMVETLFTKDTQAQKQTLTTFPQKLTDIKSSNLARIPAGSVEVDRVLGGGIVRGSVILVSGEPGIGKSTLMLDLARNVAKGKSDQPVLYVSGEESLEQMKIRAERMAIKTDRLLLLTETNVDKICAHLDKIKPVICIIDSIQTISTDDLSGVAGSVGQVRESAARLLRAGKSKGVPIFLVGHVTKSGTIAGPKVLEHLVDTVLYLEGERFGAARLLRATKNRFGATDEVGVFEMMDKGLIEVTNPSALFLKERVKLVPGSVVTATIEGTRPVLVEIQALVVPTTLPIPRRLAGGVDFNRLQIVVAVLTKRLRLPLSTYDIFVNITGGFKIEEPAADLGMALAIISSFKNVPLDPKAACFGEIGLLGELRSVSQGSKRKTEAKRLGFTKVISPEEYSSVDQVAKLFKS